MIRLDPLGKLRWKDAFPDAPFKTFRRMDRLSKLACLAAEASGVGALPSDVRRETAIVFVSTWGCLDADVGFQQSLAPGRDVKPALFPYTLPSTCLGELSVRHGLRGPTLCLSATDAALALEAARDLFALQEARAALVCLGECLTADAAELAGAELQAWFTAAVVVPDTEADPQRDLVARVDDPLPDGFDLVAKVNQLWEADRQ